MSKRISESPLDLWQILGALTVGEKVLKYITGKLTLNLVAVTRAQSLLVVIGNPTILSLDPLWRRFLNFIHSKGGWTGTTIEWNPADIVAPDQDGYDEELRCRAEREMEETLTRLKAHIINADGPEIVLDQDSDDEIPNFRDAE